MAQLLPVRVLRQRLAHKKICDPNQRYSFQRQMTIPYFCQIIFQLNQFPGYVELTGLC